MVESQVLGAKGSYMSKSNAAEQVCSSFTVRETAGVKYPVFETVVRTDDPKAWKIAKARELLDRYERGELDAVRFGAGEGLIVKMEYVETFPKVPVESEEERAFYGSDFKRLTRLVVVSFVPATTPLKVV